MSRFPIIKTIDDVLPHIEGRDEFVVDEREFGTVINYNVVMPDTFPPLKVAGGSAKMRAARELTNKMRRECRGLIFDKEGKIISRPFHKFFNIGEREETQPHKIDLSEEHVIIEKMDGSMIRPIMFDGQVRLATKMGFSDVAYQAQQWLDIQEDAALKKSYLEFLCATNITPIFEFISPRNKIVVDYEEEDLVLLAVRRNDTGEYFHDFGCGAPFNVVPQYGSIQGNLEEYIRQMREEQGKEGVIIRFVNGEMHKAKNDWYVRIHKTIDQIRFDRNIIALIINEELDDVIPMLPEEEQKRCLNMQKWFWETFEQKKNRLYGMRIHAQQTYNDDRKRIALEMAPAMNNKEDTGLLFKMIDGYHLNGLLMDKVKVSLGSNTKWEAFKGWFVK